MAFPIVAGVEFRAIVDFPGYCVGDDGSVWSCLRNRGPRHGKRMPDGDWKKRKPFINVKGYYVVQLSRDGVKCKKLVHVLVCTAFYGPCPTGMESCHNDGVPLNCLAGNLRWDTPSNNNADKKLHGTYLFGERHHLSIITEDIAKDIIRRKIAGEGHEAIALSLGLSRKHVSKIGVTSWKHLAVPGIVKNRRCTAN